jgi:hypothetical protein
MLYLTVTYIVPWVRFKLWKMSFVTIILKFFMAIPGINLLIKKGIKQGHKKVYDELDKMLFENREMIHEEMPDKPIKEDVIRERVEVSHQIS